MRLTNIQFDEPFAIIPVSNALGENILFQPETHYVWWTDILKKQLYRFHIYQNTLESFDTPYPVGSFGFTENEDEFIMAFSAGLALYNPFTKALRFVAQPEKMLKGNRFNDGRVDRQGRFWAGTMIENRMFNLDNVDASLYRLDGQLNCDKMFGGLQISNGLCWSPDSQWMYHSDSPTSTIKRYPFNPHNGQLGNPEIFIETPHHISPDGSTVDADGNLWNAQWGGGQVIQYSPNGKILRKIHLPVTQPTCVALVEHKETLLFVTSANKGLSDAQLLHQPQAGDVFIYHVKATPIAEAKFTLMK